PVTVRHRLRITTVLAADAKLEVRTHFPSSRHAELHQISDAFLVDRGEWIVLENPALHVSRQEGADIVAREAVSGLREIVGAEAEELGFLGDLISHNAG